MITATILARAAINGRLVTFFSPPHAEPDFPWVDVGELAAAFLDPGAAKRMVEHTHKFDRNSRPMVTVRNGDKIATIIPHAMAQGLCGAIDEVSGFIPDHDDDNGPTHDAYCAVAGRIAADYWPLSFEDIFHAFKNPGGPFLRGMA